MRWVILLLSLVLISGLVYSQPPSLRSTKTSGEQKQKPASNNQQTADHECPAKQLPLPVELVNPPNGNAIAEELKKDREERTTNEHSMENFNWLLVAVGILQGIALIYTALVTNKAANAAALSAKTGINQVQISREEFIASHRPRLIVRRISVDTVRGVGTQDILKVEFVVANIGDTKAKIIEMSTRVWFPESSENWPAIPPYGESTFPDLTLESGESGPLTHNDTAEMLARFQFQLAATQMQAAAEKARLLRSGNNADNEPAFLFIGYIEYRDSLERKRRTAFLRQYNFTTQRFDPILHPDYEYQD